RAARRRARAARPDAVRGLPHAADSLRSRPTGETRAFALSRPGRNFRTEPAFRMLDLKFIRENPDRVRAACVKKRIEADVDRILAIDQEVRDLKRASETLKAESNAKSKEIPKLSGPEKEKLLAALKDVSARIKESDERQKLLEEELRR